MRRTRTLVAAVVLGLVCGDAQAQVQVEPAATGTGVVSGRVTVASSGTPLRQAQVMLNATDAPVRRTTTTDGEGRYRIADLPAGRYFLTANKAGYVPGQYGQRRPSEPGTPLQLSDGQSMTGINVALPRGSVIAGRVTDEFGDPIARVMVQAMPYLFGTDGQRRLQPSASAITDDLGQFRLFGLTPGEYIVSAAGQPLGFSPAGAAAVDTSATYLTSYFPGTANVNDAQTIVVAAGQETNVQFALGVGRLSRIAGTVVDSAGRPLANARITLVSPTGRVMGGMPGGLTGPDGAFSLANVAPGDYVLNVQPIDRGGGDAPSAEAGSVSFTVGDADVLNVRVTTSAGATVNGRLVFDGTARRDGGPNGSIRVVAQSTGVTQLAFAAGADNGRVADDGSFVLKGVRGQVLFQVVAGAAWAVKSVSHEGVDITDTPVDLSGPDGLAGLTIVLTDKLTDVSGPVTDARGQPLKDFLVVVQPAEPKSAAVITRYLRTARPEPDGRFRVRGLPPGDYFATAVDALEQGRQFVPDVLARLRDTARRFSIREGETVTLDLRLTPGFE
jgi:protocatechuate 3,4-dioxygenase beta subunit